MYSILLAAVLASAALPGSEDYLAGRTLERGAKYGDAHKFYQTCVETQGPLTNYARARLAACRAASGDVSGGLAAYRRLLKGAGNEPWARMASFQLAALLATQKAHGDAAPLFTQALSFDPKPWWVDERRIDAAETFIETADTRARGFDIFRNVAATTLLRQRRIDAATQLGKSPDPADKLAAAWAFGKSAERADALKILSALAPDLIKDASEREQWLEFGRILDTKGKTLSAEQVSRIGVLAGKSDHSDWVRVFLGCFVRNETSNNRMDNARTGCNLLLKTYPNSDEAAYALWWLGNSLADDKKKIAEAVAEYERLVKQCPKHSLVDDALFAAGTLQKTARLTKQAGKTFVNLAQTCPSSRFAPCAWYWAATGEESSGNKRKATEYYERAVRYGPGDFYSHRALQRLSNAGVKGYAKGENVKVDANRSFLRAFEVKTQETQLSPDLQNDPRFQRLAFFAQHGLEEAEWEALDLAPMLKSGKDAAGIYTYMGQAGLAQTAMDYARAFSWGMKDDRPAPERLLVDYPKAYWTSVCDIAKENSVDPFLVLAVARQESTFRPALTSYAGAQGVMQLMPTTAAGLGKSDAELKKCAANLEDPSSSLKLGTRYLARMIERSDGNLAYALASYNAGPGNCDKWRVKFANTDLETFIESIPFKETRNYVKAVLGNYAAYHSLYPNP